MKSIVTRILQCLCILAITGAVALSHADNVSFNYQGTIKVKGNRYDGPGYFKFAIMNTQGSSVLWSNDGTVGAGSNPNNVPEPTAALSLPVTDGVFSIQVGDPTVPGMSPLDSAVMVSNSPLRLRVWFSDGPTGFEQLRPDHRLIDLTLVKIQTGLTDYTIYVNGATGDDANNGLTTATAKKTITGAVNILPDKVRCDINIEVADGIYRETVKIHGISVEPGKFVKFLGDSDWNTSVTAPTVQLTGLDGGSGSGPARESGFVAAQCSGIVLSGFGFEGFSAAAVDLDNGNYTVQNCKVTSSGIGIQVADSSTTFSNVHAAHCRQDGLYATRQSTLMIYNSSSIHNQINGLQLNGNAIANLRGTGEFSYNGVSGYMVQHHSSIVFSLQAPAYKGIVKGNGGAGMALRFQSYSENHTVNAFSNNAQPFTAVYGSMTTY